MPYDNFPIPEICFGIKREREPEITYKGAHQGPTWTLIPNPKESYLRIKIDAKSSDTFPIEMFFTLDDLKDMIKRIETKEG